MGDTGAFVVLFRFHIIRDVRAERAQLHTGCLMLCIWGFNFILTNCTKCVI